MAAAHRPGAARRAAQQRRRALMLIVLVAVLAALLAFELPRLLNRSSTSTEPTAPAAVVQIAVKHGKKQHAKGDPFGGNPLPNQDAKPVPGGGGDPFKGFGPPPILTQGPIPGVIAPAAEAVGAVAASISRLQSTNVRGRRQRTTSAVRAGSRSTTCRAVASASSGAPTSVFTEKNA